MEHWYPRSFYFGDEVAPEELAGLSICWESPFITEEPRRGLSAYQNPQNYIPLLRKDRGITPRFKVTYIPYKRRSISDVIS